jgi:mannose-6-phosphate isomerase-like protein (cupin superfamily)
MIIKSTYAAVQPYITKDGSIIRELMHPAAQGNRNQSLAEAIVPPGGKTHLHSHQQAEELYHFTAGQGVMQLDDQRFPVQAGDTICIPPGILHAVSNPGAVELCILCVCCPPYSHDDTDLAVTV